MIQPWQELAIGVVCMVVLGPAVGNYATSVVYRLPRGQSPFEKHPYCGGCNTFLKPEDLFPIWSYLLLRGRCRYCAMTIPSVYTWVEVACGVLFVGNYLLFGISELFILSTVLGVFWITLAALEHQQQRVFWLPLMVMCSAVLLLRAVQDGSVYPAFLSASVALMVAAGIWRLAVGRVHDNVPAIPMWVWMAMVLAALAPGGQGVVLAAGAGVVGWMAAKTFKRQGWAWCACALYYGWLWLAPLHIAAY